MKMDSLVSTWRIGSTECQSCDRVNTAKSRVKMEVSLQEPHINIDQPAFNHITAELKTSINMHPCRLCKQLIPIEHQQVKSIKVPQILRICLQYQHTQNLLGNEPVTDTIIYHDINYCLFSVVYFAKMHFCCKFKKFMNGSLVVCDYDGMVAHGRCSLNTSSRTQTFPLRIKGGDGGRQIYVALNAYYYKIM